MKINALTVCVDYSDFLNHGIDRWASGLNSLTVVTTPDDNGTHELVAAASERHEDRIVQAVTTDLFYNDGASFNKGRAMEWARRSAAIWDDWFLLFDADVVPPENWLEKLAKSKPAPGFLYGAVRFEGSSEHDFTDRGQPGLLHDVPGVGFFQLFHTTDPVVNGKPPLIDTWWLHGGNYDNAFMDRWRKPPRRRRPLAVPFRLAHVGERDNWFGRGKKKEFQDMQAERRRRGGRWDHERLNFVPIDN